MYHPYLLLYVVLACLARGEGISKNIPDAQQFNDIADTYFRNNIIPATISVCSFLISMIYYLMQLRLHLHFLTPQTTNGKLD